MGKNKKFKIITVDGKKFTQPELLKFISENLYIVGRMHGETDHNTLVKESLLNEAHFYFENLCRNEEYFGKFESLKDFVTQAKKSGQFGN